MPRRFQAPPLARAALKNLAAGQPAFGPTAIDPTTAKEQIFWRKYALRWLRERGLIEKGPKITAAGLEALSPPRAPRPHDWTAREVKTLCKVFPTHGRNAVAARLGRSPHAVEIKAQRLGVRSAYGRGNVSWRDSVEA